MTDKSKEGGSSKLLYCSFCGKSQHEVRKLIADPSVYICDMNVSIFVTTLFVKKLKIYS